MDSRIPPVAFMQTYALQNAWKEGQRDQGRIKRDQERLKCKFEDTVPILNYPCDCYGPRKSIEENREGLDQSPAISPIQQRIFSAAQSTPFSLWKS